MNINVWIITKICKALNQSFWAIFVVSSWLPTAIPVHPRPFSQNQKSEGPFCRQFLCTYKFSKVPQSACSVSCASTSVGSAIVFSSHACSGFAPFLQKTEEKLPSAQRHSRLATDLHPLSAISVPPAPGAGSARGPAGRPSSPAPRGDVEAGDHHEVGLAEVDAALQALRHALERLQVLQGVQLPHLLQVDCKEGEADGDASTHARRAPPADARPRGPSRPQPRLPRPGR